MSGPWKNCQFWDVGQQFWAPWPQFGDDTRRLEISGNPTGASISIPSRLASQQLGKEFSSTGWGDIYNSKGYSTYDMATYNDLWFCSQVKEFWAEMFPKNPLYFWKDWDRAWRQTKYKITTNYPSDSWEAWGRTWWHSRGYLPPVLPSQPGKITIWSSSASFSWSPSS